MLFLRAGSLFCFPISALYAISSMAVRGRTGLNNKEAGRRISAACFGLYLRMLLERAGLAQFACAVANDNIDDLAILMELLSIAGLHLLNESAVKFFCYQVDGAATEAATHDT